MTRNNILPRSHVVISCTRPLRIGLKAPMHAAQQVQFKVCSDACWKGGCGGTPQWTSPVMTLAPPGTDVHLRTTIGDVGQTDVPAAICVAGACTCASSDDCPSGFTCVDGARTTACHTGGIGSCIVRTTDDRSRCAHIIVTHASCA